MWSERFVKEYIKEVKQSFMDEVLTADQAVSRLLTIEEMAWRRVPEARSTGTIERHKRIAELANIEKSKIQHIERLRFAESASRARAERA